ncbi:MAG: AI-2E family transporter [Coriobacteriia bacterium]|nr:AI-2E family transporter [Coriobacteriia bacterium]
MALPVTAEDRWRGLLVATWALIGLGLILSAAFWLVWRISGALTPFVIAFVFVLVLRAPVNRLQASGMPRVVAVAVCYLLGATVLALFGALIFPPLVSQLSQFAAEAPSYYTALQEFVSGLFDRYQALAMPDWVEPFVENATRTVGNQLVAWSSSLANFLLAAGSGTVGFLFNLVLALVVGFFLLRDLPSMREELLNLFGKRRRVEAQTVYVRVITVLGGYLRGQLIIASIVGVLTTLGLWIVGVPYALVIGIVAGVFNIIPYFGPIVGGVLAAISSGFAIAAGASPWLLFWAVVVVFVVQQLESTFLAPRIMSEQVDLHPVLVIFSLLVGGTLFGFVGLLLAIPVAAVAKGLFVYYFEKHTSETLITERGAIFGQGRRSRAGERGEAPPVDGPEGESAGSRGGPDAGPAIHGAEADSETRRDGPSADEESE